MLRGCVVYSVTLFVMCKAYSWPFSSEPQLADLSLPVAVLTDDSFDEALATSSTKTWLLKFYAPWCGHCQKLAPVFEEAAIKIHGLRFAKIDATKNVALAQQYNVKSFPTLMWLRDERLRAYTGPHTLDGFATLSDTLAGEPVAHLGAEGANQALPKLRELWRSEISNKTNGVLFLAVDQEEHGTKKGPQLQAAFHFTARQFHDSITFAQMSGSEFAAMMSTPEQANQMYDMLGLLSNDETTSSAVKSAASDPADDDSAMVLAAVAGRKQRWSGWRKKLLDTSLSPPFVVKLSSGSRAAVRERARLHGAEGASVASESSTAEGAINVPGAGEGEGELPAFAPMEKMKLQQNTRGASTVLTTWVVEHEWPLIRNLRSVSVLPFVPPFCSPLNAS
jgi:protein disulfide-isomerase-like protein